MSEINVIVVDRGRENLYLRYTDPVTGQKVEKYSRRSKKREASNALANGRLNFRMVSQPGTHHHVTLQVTPRKKPHPRGTRKRLKRSKNITGGGT